MVQADFYNHRISNPLLAAITTNLRRRADPAHLFIDASSNDGRLSGLERDSLVSCLNLADLPKTDIGQIGELSDDMMRRVDECLKKALGIP